MKKETETQYNVSTYSASAIFNGDYSGCEDKEEQEIKTFMDELPKGATLSDGEETGFSRCDICGLMSDCFTLIVTEFN